LGGASNDKAATHVLIQRKKAINYFPDRNDEQIGRKSAQRNAFHGQPLI
jgi:hypothetical protein